MDTLSDYEPQDILSFENTVRYDGAVDVLLQVLQKTFEKQTPWFRKIPTSSNQALCIFDPTSDESESVV